MEISELFYQMSKPNNEKYIIVFRYLCSFIGLRFNLKKTFQQKDSVYMMAWSIISERSVRESTQEIDSEVTARKGNPF